MSITPGPLPDPDFKGFDILVDLRPRHVAERIGTVLPRLNVPMYGHGNTLCWKQVLRALHLLDTLLHRGSRVYLHCHHGINRTGCVFILWHIRHGISYDDAVTRFKSIRGEVPRHTLLRWIRSHQHMVNDTPTLLQNADTYVTSRVSNSPK